MKHVCLLAALTLGLWIPSIAHAHFVWLVQKSEAGGHSVHVHFSEDAEADNPELLKKLDRLLTQQISLMGDATELKPTLASESMTAKIDPGKGPILISRIDYGVVDRNESHKYFLVYNAKCGPAIDHPAWKKIDTSKLLGVDLIPALASSGKVEVTVLWKGKPVNKAEVTAVIPGIGEVKGETDENGKAAFEKGQTGMYAIRARVVQDERGEFNG
ncbi:hypothetical protein AYO47_05920, partial [Planctomyces sp. SCGC AG-212-M04]